MGERGPGWARAAPPDPDPLEVTMLSVPDLTRLRKDCLMVALRAPLAPDYLTVQWADGMADTAIGFVQAGDLAKAALLITQAAGSVPAFLPLCSAIVAEHERRAARAAAR